MEKSIKDGKVDYNALHASCLQSIRFLDSLILSYDGAVQGVRMVNNTLDKIITDGGKAITFKTALYRFILYLIFSIIGLFWALFNKESKSLPDKVLGLSVIKVKSAS